MKLYWVLLKQDTMEGGDISSLTRANQLYLVPCRSPSPAHQQTVFVQPRCPSCHSTNSVKALKAAL